MLSDEIRSRLELLNRQPLPPQPPPGVPSSVTTASPPPSALAPDELPLWQAPASSGCSRPASSGSSERSLLAFGSKETIEVENASGRHLRLLRPLVDYWPQGEREIAFGRRGGESSDDDRHLHPELAAFAAHFPRGALFLDLETCGFAGSMVFLIGLLWHSDGQLVLDQLFARNYEEERAILETLWQIAGQNSVLITFNGKSFDWPMVHDRSTRHHLGREWGSPTGESLPNTAGTLGPHDLRPRLIHCDLLHHARRRWRRKLPNCKLQTLERYLCQRHRRDDISGAQIPVAYHRFVRTGDDRQIHSILQHNALDLVTLLQVMLKIVPGRPASA